MQVGTDPDSAVIFNLRLGDGMVELGRAGNLIDSQYAAQHNKLITLIHTGQRKPWVA